MKREINMRSDRNQANQLIENSLKEYKKSIGEVILVSVGPRTTIELPASLTQAEREARIEIYKNYIVRRSKNLNQMDTA